MRTVWVAGLCLVAVGGLFATKVVPASASRPDDTVTDATAALRSDADPYPDTLTRSDRGAEAAPDADETVAIPLESATVRPASAARHPATTVTRKRPTALARKVMVAPPKKMTQAKPGADQAKPATGCQPRDPIARFLASASLAPRCAG
jgi:hypothetical protein